MEPLSSCELQPGMLETIKGPGILLRQLQTEPGGLRARHQDSDLKQNLYNVKKTSFPSLVQKFTLHCKYPLLTTTFLITLPLM
jgi:hypothetical protein